MKGRLEHLSTANIDTIGMESFESFPSIRFFQNIEAIGEIYYRKPIPGIPHENYNFQEKKEGHFKSASKLYVLAFLIIIC